MVILIPGDVLTGIITSLLGLGLDPFDGAKLGVYLQRLAGDIVRDRLGEYGMIASDIVGDIHMQLWGWNIKEEEISL